MERADLGKIEELLRNLKTDKNAPKSLFRLFSGSMYSEAKLYISDVEKAKDACMQAFRHSYAQLSKASAQDVEDVLKQAVMDECVRNTEFESPNTVYSSDDEMPDQDASVPEQTEKIKAALRKVLDRLTSGQRIISVMKYRDGLSFEDISEKLNIPESLVMSIFQDAKNSLKAGDADLGQILAYVNKLYPFYEEEKAEDEGVITLHKNAFDFDSSAVNDEEQFNTTVNELKEFFNTKALSTRAISDHGIDDTDESEYDLDQGTLTKKAVSNTGEDIDDTASSAKMIMAAAMSAEADKKKHDEKYNPFTYWAKRAAIILALIIAGFGIAIGVSALRSKKNTPVNTPETAETETAEPEVSEEPESTPEIEETPEPDDGIIGSANIMVTDLTIRSGAGVNYEQSGLTEYGATYDVYEIAEADGYTWYRVGEGQWVADYLGQYVAYTPKE